MVNTNCVDYTYPRYIPAPPAPAHTLPKTIPFIFGAAPHNALPAANMVKHPINIHFVSKIAYAFPSGKIKTTDPRRNPTPSQPIWVYSSGTSPAIAPWMSATIVLSRPNSRFAEKMAMQTNNQRVLCHCPALLSWGAIGLETRFISEGGVSVVWSSNSIVLSFFAWSCNVLKTISKLILFIFFYIQPPYNPMRSLKGVSEFRRHGFLIGKPPKRKSGLLQTVQHWLS